MPSMTVAKTRTKYINGMSRVEYASIRLRGRNCILMHTSGQEPDTDTARRKNKKAQIVLALFALFIKMPIAST
jgi:hypothetical protein